MSHVDDGTLHALVDDALDDGERAAVEAHLAGCGECARRFAEATAMARQVITLLGALDVETAPVRIAKPPAVVQAPPRPAPGVTTRTRMITLRRVALAASVLLVAGVSYQVGQREAAAPASVVLNTSARESARSMAPRTVPSVVDAAADSYVAAPTPPVRGLRRGGPRVADAEVTSDEARGVAEAAPMAQQRLPQLVAAPVTDVPVQTSSQVAQKQAQSTDRANQAEQRTAVSTDQVAREQSLVTAPASVQAAAPRTAQASARRERDAAAGAAVGASAAAMTPAPVAPTLTPLAGYTAVEDVSVPAMTRRRYLSPSGVTLELSIVSTFAPRKDTIRTGAPSEFVVSSANGRSTVRWHARGLEYVLHGPLAPDSLVKLATQLKP